MATEVLESRKNIYVYVLSLIHRHHRRRSGKKNQMRLQFIGSVNAVTCGDICFFFFLNIKVVAWRMIRPNKNAMLKWVYVSPEEKRQHSIYINHYKVRR